MDNMKKVGKVFCDGESYIQSHLSRCSVGESIHFSSVNGPERYFASRSSQWVSDSPFLPRQQNQRPVTVQDRAGY